MLVPAAGGKFLRFLSPNTLGNDDFQRVLDVYSEQNPKIFACGAQIPYIEVLRTPLRTNRELLRGDSYKGGGFLTGIPLINSFFSPFF